MTYIDYLRIFGSIACYFGALIGFVWLIRQHDRFDNVIWFIILPFISVGYFVGMVFLAVWLGLPYTKDCGPDYHSPDCNTRINGLWLPGRGCDCGVEKY